MRVVLWKGNDCCAEEIASSVVPPSSQWRWVVIAKWRAVFSISNSFSSRWSNLDVVTRLHYVVYLLALLFVLKQKFFLFFCLETKEPKVQDWIILLKNGYFFWENPQNSGGIISYSLDSSVLPPLRQWGFLGIVTWQSRLEEITIFLNAKCSEVNWKIGCIGFHLFCHSDEGRISSQNKIRFLFLITFASISYIFLLNQRTIGNGLPWCKK